jgi:hypothetical protein
VKPLTSAQKIEKFKKQAIKQVPGLPILKLSDDEWVELCPFREEQLTSRLSSTYILQTLSDIRKPTTYDDLIRTLTKESLPRAAKKASTIEPTYVAKRKCFRQTSDSRVDTTLVFEKTEMTTAFNSPMAKKGIRVSSLTPATPVHGYSCVKRTPKGTQLRQAYSNSHGSIYKFLTPIKPDGRVSLNNAKRTIIELQLPKLRFERTEDVYFQATLQKILTRQGVKRRIGQNTLMKASCQEVFAAHGVETVKMTHGSKYHWSHLIAHFLGGEQSRTNLGPATAASNYNTLELVEEFIAKKLSEDNVSSIGIHVELKYSGESLIADEIIFRLNWIDNDNKSGTEMSHINPRSHQRFSQSFYDAIDLLRGIVKPPEALSVGQIIPPPNLTI